MQHNSDPRNGFHEIRRYLLARGIDTRPLTNEEYPKLINQGKDGVSVSAIGSVDNAFYFMLRKVYQTDSVPVLVNVFMVRVFFPYDQDHKSFLVQICFNQYGNGLFEINQAYHKVLETIQDQGWSTLDAMHNTLTYEQCFADVQIFKLLFQSLYAIFREHDLLNNNLIPVETSL